MRRRNRHWRRAAELRKALLEVDTLVPLIQADPERARRVLVAAIATPPQRGYEMLGDRRERLGITDEPNWLGPVPERGPFRAFLQLAPVEGLETIIELTERATTAAMATDDVDAEFGEGETDEGFEMCRNGRWVRLVGSSDVMQWHRGNTFVPSVLASGLMAVEAELYRRLDEGQDVSEPIERIMRSESLALIGLLVSVACYRPDLLTGLLRPLATSAGLLLADRLYKGQPHNDLLIPMLGERGVFAERLQQWHTMPHRDQDLSSHVMSYVLDEGPLSDDVASARARWTSSDRQRWRHLAAQMDPANYEVVGLADGRRGWQYASPPELRAEVEASNAEVAAAGFWLAGPHRWRKLIDEGARPSDEELEQAWHEWRAKLESLEPDDALPMGMHSRIDIECGVAAFFVVCAIDWVSADADKLSWCRVTLLSPCTEPPPAPEFDSGRTFSADRWDGFAADAIPVLWARDPEDRALRSAIAALAVHPHYETVGRLFDSVMKQAALKDDLVRLERLVLHWARYEAWRHEKRMREQTEAYPDLEGPRLADLPDVETPTLQLYAAFCSGELEPELPSLEAFIHETPEGMIGRRARGRHRLVASLSFEYFWAAFRHLLWVPEDADRNDRARRIRFASQFASAYASGLAPEEGEQEIDGHPYEVEWLVLDALGRMTVSVTLVDARGIWRPLVASGVAADDWLEVFLRAIWRATLGPDLPPRTAVALLKEMLGYVADDEAWSSSRSWPYDSEETLAGLDGYTGGELRSEHAELFRALQPEWSSWVEPRVHNHVFARSLARFVRRQAGELVLEAALGWLARRESEGARVDDRLDDELEELLLYLASSHEQLFRRQDPTGAATRTLLAALTARLRPVALELTSRFG